MEDNQHASSGRAMFIVAWLLFFALVMAFFYYYESNDKGHYQVQRGVLTITADKAGHYQLAGSINDKPVQFLLDTGATLVAIPEGLATSLQLKRRYPISMQTANGVITGSLTRLNKLNFAEFELLNVKAVIIPGSEDDQVLLGMNVLSKFNMSQQNGQLVIKK